MTAQPTAVHITEDAIIETANDAMIRVWGKDKEVIGKSLEDALPELRGQPYLQQFKDVWNKGVTISGRDAPADLVVDGELRTFYFDYEYRAIKDDQGKTYAILHTATDVTERYLGSLRERGLLDELMLVNEELTASNEEIKASNEELAATNEELLSTTEELVNSQHELEKLNSHLAKSEAQIRSLIRQAPVGMCLINAEDLRIPEVNDEYLQLVGKEREEFQGRTIWEVVPEAAEIYAPVMRQVIESGITFRADEHELILIRKGVPERVFVNFVYEPIRDDACKVTAILVVGYEVTELVRSRESIAIAEERSRLAVEAAGAGLFDLNLESGEYIVSGRFNEIFGSDKVPDEDFLNEVTHPDDRAARLAAHARALQTGVLFFEARLLKEGSVCWVRAEGKVIEGKSENSRRMLGTVVDITDFKTLQNQKDDFISIASHELKTPVTSLKAAIQLIDRLKDKPDQKPLPKLILQARRSIERVSILIDDLLNVSRLQQPDIALNKTAFILSQLINNVVSPIAISSDKKIIISGDLQVIIYADEHRIDQVLTNLIGNAVKYAPLSEYIEVNISKEDKHVKVSVKDEGPGIPQEKLAQIFERYVRVNPTGDKTSGLGLGLFICSEIVRKHGGQIGVESTPGEGSSFWFTLPIELKA